MFYMGDSNSIVFCSSKTLVPLIPDYLKCSINNGIPIQGILHKKGIMHNECT